MAREHSSETRTNPADPNRWNAWRYPTQDEIARGRQDYDMFYVGSSETRNGAYAFLPRNEAGQPVGQVQWARDGEVINVP